MPSSTGYTISKQPGLAPKNAGVKFGLELEKRVASSTSQSKKTKGANATESTSTVVGFRAVVREGYSRGHIVEIRKKRKDEGMFGAVSLPSCFGGGEEESASSTSKGYTSTVFSTKDIEYVEIVESSLELDAAAAAGGACAMCAPCCPCLCSAGTEEVQKIETSDKAIAVHLANKKTPIMIDWSDMLGQINDQPGPWLCPLAVV